MNLRNAYPLESRVETWIYFKVAIYLTLSLKGDGEGMGLSKQTRFEDSGGTNIAGKKGKDRR